MPMKTYLILLRGPADVNDLNLMSPHQMTLVHASGTTVTSGGNVIRADTDCTTLSILTDQSGMIGLLRHLHNLGLEILSMTVQSETLSDEIERKAE